MSRQDKNGNSDIKQEFLELYDEHSDAVYRRCFFKTSDEEVAQDLTQEAFFKTWDYIASGKEVRHLKGFVFTVANNLIKDYYKKKKAVAIGDMEGFDPSFIRDNIENIEAKAEVEQVLSVLEQLNDKDRDVLIMNLVEGLAPREIADVFDERVNTISVRIHRAKKKLRELMSENNS